MSTESTRTGANRTFAPVLNGLTCFKSHCDNPYCDKGREKAGVGVGECRISVRGVPRLSVGGSIHRVGTRCGRRGYRNAGGGCQYFNCTWDDGGRHGLQTPLAAVVYRCPFVGSYGRCQEHHTLQGATCPCSYFETKHTY